VSKPASTPKPDKAYLLRHALLAGAIVVLLVMIGVHATHVASVESDLRIAVGEAQALSEAFGRYYSSHGAFPNAYADPRFECDTLEPLRRRGYYDGFITATLVEGRLDAYFSPDDRGLNQEYWLEMTLERDPSIRIVVARSDDAPLGSGEWLEGVYLYRHGSLEKI